MNFVANVTTDFEFHHKKLTICDFNVLYEKFCVEQFVGKNGPEIFVLLEGKIQTLKEEDMRI